MLARDRGVLFLRGLYYDTFNSNIFNVDIFIGIVKNSE